jgi:hypothetical protein
MAAAAQQREVRGPDINRIAYCFAQPIDVP